MDYSYLDDKSYEELEKLGSETDDVFLKLEIIERQTAILDQEKIQLTKEEVSTLNKVSTNENPQEFTKKASDLLSTISKRTENTRRARKKKLGKKFRTIKGVVPKATRHTQKFEERLNQKTVKTERDRREAQQLLQQATLKPQREHRTQRGKSDTRRRSSSPKMGTLTPRGMGGEELPEWYGDDGVDTEFAMMINRIRQEQMKEKTKRGREKAPKPGKRKNS